MRGDKEYYNFVLKKRKTDADKHERISNQKDTAFAKLMEQERGN